MDKNKTESLKKSSKKSRAAKGIYKIGEILHIVYNNVDGKQIWESARCNKIRDAEAFRAKRLLEVREGKNPALKVIPNITLKKLAPDYLTWAEQRLKSYRSRKGYVTQLVNDLGHMPLNKFTIGIIEKWQSERITVKGNMKSTVDSLLGTLKHMFVKAQEWDMVTDQVI